MVDQGWSGETRMIDVERPSDSITETRTNGARVGAQSKLPLSRQWVSGPMSLRAGRPSTDSLRSSPLLVIAGRPACAGSHAPRLARPR